MNVFISLETWDIDDTLMLLFLLHYHELGKIKVLGVEVDSGTLEQNNFIDFILRKVGISIPVFSRNISNGNRKEIPSYYYDFFEDLERGEMHLTERSEVFDYLRNKEFKIIVGGGLSLIKELVERNIIPEEVVIQGGFAGKNITGRRNPKFGDRNFQATFNFNKDLKSTFRFLELQKNLRFPLYLVSKNVNHLITLKEEDIPEIETRTEPQKLYINILKKYLSEKRKEKSLHDVYAALALFDKSLFEWKEVSPIVRLSGRYPEWGAVIGRTNVFITVGARNEKIKELVSFKEEIV